MQFKNKCNSWPIYKSRCVHGPITVESGEMGMVRRESPGPLPQASVGTLSPSPAGQVHSLCFPSSSLLGHTWKTPSACLAHLGPDTDVAKP